MVSVGEVDGLRGGIPQKARQGQNFGRGKLRVKPESRAWRARVLRAKPEPRVQPEIDRGRGLGRGSVSPSPENFWKFKFETVQSDVHLKQKSISFIVLKFGVSPSLNLCANCKIKMWKPIYRGSSLELKRCSFKGAIARVLKWGFNQILFVGALLDPS